MADAAHLILTRKSRKATGNFYIDEDVLGEEGFADDLSRYNYKKDAPFLAPDFFV
jgi:citronellol/citronellal dehydrogenase